MHLKISGEMADAELVFLRMWLRYSMLSQAGSLGPLATFPAHLVRLCHVTCLHAIGPETYEDVADNLLRKSNFEANL